MATTPAYIPIISNKSYSKSTELKWFGTVIGTGERDKFVIAASSVEKCLEAAQRYYPDANAEKIQMITILKRDK
jgi:hypothetical protein